MAFPTPISHKDLAILLTNNLVKARTLIKAQSHGPMCHLRSDRPFSEKAREEWDSKGCDCWLNEVLEALQPIPDELIQKPALSAEFISLSIPVNAEHGGLIINCVTCSTSVLLPYINEAKTEVAIAP